MNLPAHLLLVDDDETFRLRMAAALRERGLEVTTAADFDEATALAASQRFDVIVTDLKMPGPSGLEVLRALSELQPDARMLVLTGYGTIATAVEAMRLGAVDYLVKPCNADQLLAAVVEPGHNGNEQDLALHTPSLAKLEREHIERVLVECEGNVSKAARVLGIHRRTLQYKLSKFPVDR